MAHDNNLYEVKKRYSQFSKELFDLLSKYDLNFGCEEDLYDANVLEIKVFLHDRNGKDLFFRNPKNENEENWNQELKECFDYLT